LAFGSGCHNEFFFLNSSWREMTNEMSFKVKGKVIGSGESAVIEMEKGFIQAVHSSLASSDGIIGSGDLWLGPAFFDIQVNGFAGVDLNSGRVTLEELEQVMVKLREKGVALFCPTIITNSFEHMAACFRAIAQVCHNSRIAQAIPALHMEGPYISPQEGPRGAHPLEHIRTPSWDEFQRLQECAQGLIGMLTLAPELDGAISLTEKLTDSGVAVAIGHTAAGSKDIQAAIRAGAKSSTHLGNGSHAVIPRHDNYIWEQLASDELWASFIVDGHHLPPSVVKCLVRAKGINRSILTSDAIVAAGMPPGKYRLGDTEVVVSPELRVERADTAGSGYLAGSALDLLRGVENVVRFTGVSLEEAIRMASLNPATLMGITERLGKIEAGREANLIVFQWDEVTKRLSLKYTIHQGEVVYKA
jgi:N-acetylglucosamine-6-phosphate deacetylase